MQAWKKLCEDMVRTASLNAHFQRWLAHLRSGNFDVQDTPHTSYTATTDDDEIQSRVETNRRLATREVAEKLHLLNLIVFLHLQQVGCVNKQDVWVPYELREIHLAKRIEI